MEKEKTRVKGNVFYVLRDKEGNIKDEREISNQTQILGFSAIASLIATDNPGSETTFDYMAIGIGTAQTIADTALASEITTAGGERRGGVDVVATLTGTDDEILQFQTTYTFTGAFAVTEAGIFNDASAGTMLCYQDFAAINVSNGDSLQITWQITFGV